MIFCFDLDGVLCRHVKDYMKAKPFKKRIKIVNDLHDDGHRIIIDTARGAVTGIDWFDKINLKIGFHYENHEKQRINLVMTSNEFITALIQHIPPPNFKMVRYYLAYSRRRKTCFFDKKQSGIKQLTLNKFGLIKEIRCPICKNNLIFIHYSPKPPSKELPIQRELEIWIN